jgi:PadR family transcriptional regulator, regulatory protein PadR
VTEIRLSQPALKVLRLLLDAPLLPRSGAEIAKATRVASGTLYPMLVRLETAGWLSSEWENIEPREQGRPRRRFYKLTSFGQNSANRELADLQINLATPEWKT